MKYSIVLTVLFFSSFSFAKSGKALLLGEDLVLTEGKPPLVSPYAKDVVDPFLNSVGINPKNKYYEVLVPTEMDNSCHLVFFPIAGSNFSGTLGSGLKLIPELTNQRTVTYKGAGKKDKKIFFENFEVVRDDQHVGELILECSEYYSESSIKSEIQDGFKKLSIKGNPHAFITSSNKNRGSALPKPTTVPAAN